MGFNNKGVDHLVSQLEKFKPNITLGINIGKNKTTSNESAANDYIHCFDKVQHLADYITLNISSPNTKDLRQLQQSEYLLKLLAELKKTQLKWQLETGKYTPILVKIAPDQSMSATKNMAKIIQNAKMDGIICTNTTIERNNLKKDEHQNEIGGLSGKPLFTRSNQVIKAVRAVVGSEFPIIGVGGILTDDDVMSKISAGANLIQVYTGFIYKGPQLIKSSNLKLKETFA
jgi:dihydroorotate dehydrogenase